jgi:hypothetical protein
MIFQDTHRREKRAALNPDAVSLVLVFPEAAWWGPQLRRFSAVRSTSFLVKIPVPWSPEASYGVVAMDGTMVLNRPLVNRLELSERELEMATAAVLRGAQGRERLYRRGRPFPELAGRTVILVDDGLASGYSMLAAVNFAAKRKPRSIIAAAPIASDAACRLLGGKRHRADHHPCRGCGAALFALLSLQGIHASHGRRGAEPIA